MSRRNRRVRDRDDDGFGESGGGRDRPKTDSTKTFENPHKITFVHMGSTCKSNPALSFKAKFFFDTGELTIKLPPPESVQILSQEIKCGAIKFKQVQDGRYVTVYLDADRDVWEEEFMLELKHQNGSHTDITKYQFEVTFKMQLLVSSPLIENIFRFLASKPRRNWSSRRWSSVTRKRKSLTSSRR